MALPAVPLSPEYLLQGAAYALEQCGHLLRDANLLYKHGSYSTAVGVATFAREELGRYRILLGLRREALDGVTVTIKDIRARTNDHVIKQERGMLSITLTNADGPEIGPLIRAKITAEPGTPAWREAEEALHRIQRKKRKQTPRQRHEQRMSTTYVEPLDGGWSRPLEALSKEDAQRFIMDAVNDYSVQYHQRYITGDEPMLRYIDEPLFHALEGWAQRPTLEPPQWPLQ